MGTEPQSVKHHPPPHSERLLGQMLLKAGLITQAQLDAALATQRHSSERIASILARDGAITEARLATCLGQQCGVESVDLSADKPDAAALKLVPALFAHQHLVLPLHRVGTVLTVAMANPGNITVIDDLRFMTGHVIAVKIALETAIKGALNKYYDTADRALEHVRDFEKQTPDAAQVVDELDPKVLLRASEEAPVMKLVALIMADATKKGASDIHLEPYERGFRIRFRIDGVLYEVMSPPKAMHAAVTSRVKIMARLDIAERRMPQDGRIKLDIGDRELDLRVSTIPTLFGEKVVMRLLDRASLELDMGKLGLEPEALTMVEQAITAPYGTILVTGPTGSGKTTTLYSALMRLNTIGTNIMTCEDPVEYNLEGINQVQVKPDIGLDFAVMLRSFLRQDPDVIMVGEIRDFETAEIAAKAALTGHLVLSTVHTNDAPSTVNRLISMGLPAYLVVASLNLIVAQRLARRVCGECRTEAPASPTVLESIGCTPEEAKNLVTYQGKGCMSCSDTGYRGRIGLFEVMVLTEEIREAILRNVSTAELQVLGMKYGMKTLRQSALEKLREGVTSVTEVARITAMCG